MAGAYNASRHALLGFSGSVFEDVREAGVKVCAICPGLVDTGSATDRKRDASRMIQPEDIAEAVLFVVNAPETMCPTEIVLQPQRTP